MFFQKTLKLVTIFICDTKVCKYSQLYAATPIVCRREVTVTASDKPILEPNEVLVSVCLPYVKEVCMPYIGLDQSVSVLHTE